jgi:hypothetical protein
MFWQKQLSLALGEAVAGGFSRDLVTYHFVTSKRREILFVTWYLYLKYERCLENIQPFWISREPVTWPWCKLAASQRRAYCTSVNSHSTVGLVSRQRDAVDWACVLCDRRISHISSLSKAILTLGKVAGSQILAVGVLTDLDDVTLCQKRLHDNCRMRRRIVLMKLMCSLCHCECDGRTIQKVSQRRLTADWLDPRERGHATGSRDIQNGWILSGQPS